MGKLELQKFRVLMDRQPAILAIKKEEGCSMVQARDKYNKCLEYAVKGIYILTSSFQNGAYDKAYIFRRFKDLGIVDFELVDLEAEEEQKRQKEFAYKLEKAKEWVETLSEEQQEMIETLIESNRFYPACG